MAGCTWWAATSGSPSCSGPARSCWRSRWPARASAWWARLRGAFALGALLAGLAGVFGGSFLALYPGADSEILLQAVVVVILGGPGSLLGAVVGSLLVGLIHDFAVALTPDLLYFTLFAPMVLVLAWRPYGLLGRPL